MRRILLLNVESKIWKQPVLTDNGTIGGTKFAVDSNIIQNGGAMVYFTSDNVLTNCFHSRMISSNNSHTIGYITLYNPKPLCIKNIEVFNQHYSTNVINRAMTNGSIRVSNDGVNYTPIYTIYNTEQGKNVSWNIDLSFNNNYYKYYRIYNDGQTVKDNWGSYTWVVGELKITGYIE